MSAKRATAQEEVDLFIEREVRAMEAKGHRLISEGKVAEGLDWLEIGHHTFGVYAGLEPNCSALSGLGVYHAG